MNGLGRHPETWPRGSPKSVVRCEKGAKLLRQLSFVLEQLLKKTRSLELQVSSRANDPPSQPSDAMRRYRIAFQSTAS